MRKWMLLCILAVRITAGHAQSDTLPGKELEEAVIYSNKFLEKKKNIAQPIDVIGSRQISKANAQNTGDLLIGTGRVFVQKSQQGGSSPVLRGFEASRVLIVIDGVRHNTAIFRAGHLQNIITVDQNMLERVEVMYGPSSTLYGSDALGGIVHLRTKSPRVSGKDKMLAVGTAFSRFSSANEEKTVHADLNLGWKKWAWLSSFTFSDFGDMRMGKNYPDKYPAFGRRDSLIAFFGFKDSVIANPDPEVQRHSGYKQWDALNKILFQPSEKVTHTLNFQYSNSTDVPRYDRLQDKRNFGGAIGNTLRFAEWFYGPQERLLGSYELQLKRPGFLDELRTNLNYQYVEESRQQREYRRYDRFDSRRENVKVWGFMVDARKTWNSHELNFGIDGQFNDVRSRADRTNLTTGAVSKLDSRYPDGKNRMNYAAIFAQHLFKWKAGKWVLNDGIRFQTVSLRSNVIDNSFFNLPVTNFSQHNFAVTGNIGLVYMPDAATRVSLGLSSGFRSPNIDDLVKVFDFSVANRVYVPNPGLDPEYTYNADLTLSRRFGKVLRAELNGFFTRFVNAIVGAPFKLNGQDSISYNGVMSAVYANQNLNKGRTYGWTASLRADLTSSLVLQSTASYTRGRLIRTNGSEVPQDHIPPFFGKTSLEYNKGKWGLDLFAQYNGWKRIGDYNPDGEDNQQYATPDGMPAWTTFNFRLRYDITEKVQFQGAVENISDRNYRYFASGFSAPGRNFILALRANW